MTKTRILSMVTVLALAAAPAFADTVTLADGPGGTSGGEFYADPSGGLDLSAYAGFNLRGSDPAISFATFCVEVTENVNIPGGPYDYALQAGAVGGGSAGGNPDNLSGGTSALYAAFAGGVLGGYDHGSNTVPTAARIANADTLQLAIWYLEDESLGAGQTTGNNAFLAAVEGYFGSLATAKLDAVAGVTDFGVKVLHLTENGAARQDLLYVGPTATGFSLTTGVPDGGTTMSLFGLAMAGLGVLARRRK